MSSLGMTYICRYYGVPAEVGGRVRYTGGGRNVEGTIVGYRGPYLRIRLDGETHVGSYHPTWELAYLTEGSDGR